MKMCHIATVETSIYRTKNKNFTGLLFRTN